jgi:SAM-dependent methyltransferase
MQDVPESELNDSYGEGYYNGDAYDDYLAKSDATLAHFRSRLDDISRAYNVSAPGHCLEIGCAFGLFLVAARERGWIVKGIEISKYAASYARAQFDLDVRTDEDALATIESQSQNLVVMWDVIEHLKYPLTVLREIRRILTPSGVLVLSTGNAGSLGARLFGKSWFLIAPPLHQFYFDRKSVRALLDAAGLTVQLIQSEGHPLQNMGRYPLLDWVARKDRFVGWRLKSGPIMTVVAAPHI